MTRLRTREGKLSFFLLMLMLLSITWSMELASWVEGLYVAEWTALGGLVLGFLMTRLGWPRVVSHLVGVAVGAMLALAVTGGVVGPRLAWRDGIGAVAYHFDVWLRVVMSGRSSGETVAFVLMMTLLTWWIGYTCAWMVFGAHRAWQALGLSGAAMMVVAYASPPEVAPFFVLYVFCALLLAVRLHIFTQAQSWTAREARYDRDIALHFLRDGGLLVLAVLAVVWIVPLLSSSSALSDLWARIEDPWRTVGAEWNRLFPGVLGHGRGYEHVPYGTHLALGGPIDLGEDVVMWIETDGARYWRGAVYDRYDGSTWENTDSASVFVPANVDLPIDGQYEMRQLVEQRVVPRWSGTWQVFHLGEPSRVDLPVDALFSHADAPGADADDAWSAPASVSIIKTRVPINVDRPYRVYSSTSVADAASLRAAGEVYPAWVTGRYLQLPLTSPERVAELAGGIVAPHDNPYDRAAAIQDYLRRTIQYREDVQAPPEDRDAVDYLLFESRAGYCNYYASAMVVMARSVGIPSRLAVGYLGGELERETERYAVRERDAHAWVEIYFPRYGWVEFEPTASEEPVRRPEPGEEERPDATALDLELGPGRDVDEFWDDPGDAAVTPAAASGQERSSSRALVIVVGAVMAAAGASAVWLVARMRLGGASGVGRVYGAVCRYGRLIGVGAEASQTPYEYARVLGQSVPLAAQGAERIAELYVRDRFGPRGIGTAEEQEAQGLWEALRPIMQKALMRKVFLRLSPQLDRRRLR